MAFCDLVSSTTLVERLDPEAVRDVLLAYQESCASIVKRYGGRIARFMGDGLLVCFGHPVAHEDDARRATLAALEMSEAVTCLSEQVEQEHGVPLALRVGIDTGLVIASDMGGGDWREPDDLIGPAVNVAARIQAEAEPRRVLVSGATQKLVEGYFETRSLGHRSLRGIADPVELVEVVAPSPARSRLEATSRRTPLLGRAREREALTAAWARAAAGAAEAMVIEGDAGIGKSRLAEWLLDVIPPDAVPLVLQCSPYHTDSALYPVAHLLEREAGPPADGDQRRWERLRASLERAGPIPEPDLALLARLGSVPLPPGVVAPALTPDQEREHTFAALLAWFARLAEATPVLTLVEDLQWADPSTLELVNRALAPDIARRTLMVVTTRPGHADRLGTLVPVLALEPLSVRDRRMMVAGIDGANHLPPDLHEVVAERSGGIPLFIEELTRMLVAPAGAQAQPTLDDPAIPPTLHELLAARLEQLPDERPVAEVVATVGETTSYQLLRLVHPIDEEALRANLDQLLDAGILRTERANGDTTYGFCHVLLRDAAYQGQLHSQRRMLHNRIAATIEASFPEVAERRPEVLARHLEHGGQLLAAARHWHRAGLMSAGRAAHVEALAHFTRAVGLLEDLPEDGERTELQLGTQIGLGMSHIALRGYAADEAQQAYARAVEVACSRGRPAVTSLFGLWAYYVVRGDHRLAANLAEQCFAAARADGEPKEILEARAILGYQRFCGGEFDEARRHLEEGAQWQPATGLPDLPHDPGVASLATLAHTLWVLGSPAEARRAIAEALARAEELDFPIGPFTRAYAFTHAAWFHQLASEPDEAAALAAKAVDVAMEHGFASWALAATLHLAIASGTTGSPEGAIEILSSGIGVWRGAGAELFVPYFQSGLAECHRRTGDLAKARACLDEALRDAEARGECFYRAELLRLRGELRAEMEGEADAAEADLRAAVAVAARQQALAFELRAAASLQRYGLARGRESETEPVLAAVVARLPADLEMPELVAARDALELINS